MAGKAHDLSGPYWNDLLKELRQWAVEVYQEITDAFEADGYPPFHEPLNTRLQYNELLALRASGSSLYWDDPEAVARLEVLAKRYGPPGQGATPAVPGYPTLFSEEDI